MSSEEIRAQALENMQGARAHIGDETLQKIAALMTKKQQSAVEQAKREINAADTDKVLDEFKYMMRHEGKLD